MEGLPLGAHFQPTDQEILFYLRCYAEFGQPLDGGFIGAEDLRYFQAEQSPDARSLGRLYYYTNCFYRQMPGRPTRDRRTVEGKGRWKATEGQKTIYQSSEIVGYKQDFRFCRLEASGKEVSTSWVMTEYTLHSNKSNNNNMIAVCVLRNTREGQGRGTTQYEAV